MLLATLLEKQVKLPLVSTVGTSCLLSDPEPEIDVYVVCCYCSMQCRVDCYRLTAHQSVSQIAETLLCSKKCTYITLLITACHSNNWLFSWDTIWARLHASHSSITQSWWWSRCCHDIHFIIVYVKVTWLNPAGGQFDIKWDVAMCSSQHHGNTNNNGLGGNHLQSKPTLMIYSIINADQQINIVSLKFNYIINFIIIFSGAFYITQYFKSIKIAIIIIMSHVC